jgi:two-component system NtrC family sensor kinase
MLKEKCKDLCGQKSSDTILKIEKASNRIAKIVNSLNSFARQSGIEKKPVDIKVPITLCLDMIAVMFSKEEIEIETDFSRCTNPIFIGNENGIQQVIMNLLTNARDAIKEARQTGKVQILVENKYDKLIISVTDNGTGIKDEHMPTLFDPFFTTKDIGKGTGLGLSISMSLIKGMGGTLAVKSKVGEGTTFIISLQN